MTSRIARLQVSRLDWTRKCGATAVDREHQHCMSACHHVKPRCFSGDTTAGQSKQTRRPTLRRHPQHLHQGPQWDAKKLFTVSLPRVQDYLASTCWHWRKLPCQIKRDSWRLAIQEGGQDAENNQNNKLQMEGERELCKESHTLAQDRLERAGVTLSTVEHKRDQREFLSSHLLYSCDTQLFPQQSLSLSLCIKARAFTWTCHSCRSWSYCAVLWYDRH